MLTDFKQDYILRYEDILSKVNVSMKSLGSTRFESNLKFGDTVNRTILDLSAVRVRSFTNLSDQTIDPLTDSEETMTVNVQAGAVFPISRLEKIQAGPLNPAMTAGKEVAMKISNFLDAVVLAETRNAFADFDTGNLTTAASNGTAITLNSTTVPQMVAQSYAKLFSNNVAMTNLCWVLDPFSVSQIAQYPIGKDITSANTVFINGFSGNIFGAEVYTSNNLTGEAVLGLATNPTNGDTIVIGGVTVTFLATLAATPGAVHIASTVDITRANLAAHLNAPSVTEAEATDTGYVAFSAADQIKLVDVLGIGSSKPNGVAVVNDNTANTLTIVAVGSSRLTLSETLTDGTDAWTKNFVHAYYGMKGSVDVAIQDKPTMEMREEAKQLTTNIFNNVVAAVKTFTDGSQKFLDVHIANA
jgi:hypothetical protein